MTKEQLQNVRVACDVLGERGKVGTRAVHQLLDWIDELERHAEADAANAKHMRSQLAEALANEQSSAKAYAELQAREALLEKQRDDLFMQLGKHADVPKIEYQQDKIADLVGVIKTLIAALAPFAGEGMLSAAQGMTDEVIIRFEASAREIREAEAALRSTREIRERIGAL